MKILKKIAFYIILGVSFISCSDDDEEVKEKDSLIGTWQLVQTYANSGAGPGNWNEVEDGYTYTFLQNGDFYSTRFDECTSGTFSTESNLLILDFGCDGFTTGIEAPEGVFVEEYIFDNGLLVTNPTYLTCIEGCGFKFRKMVN
ncbi:hypothetical protein OQ279_17490 [Salinimicrobium sp. MT39]|uniref:Lipocalin-like domain-containing protein n=1 Tax=Salinimicrobium profundisediminis TaxID=2994553 RepID=A0A9X3D032_9FLAO|nr:lipocalin family protein [Salinimicrobium profundisediminis]MCX2839923.1 hypothetical protein [Salinimicrobium profundisediminis]